MFQKKYVAGPKLDVRCYTTWIESGAGLVTEEVCVTVRGARAE